MTIMPNETGIDNSIFICCKKFIKRFQINQLLRQSNATKEKGVKTYDVFAFLLGLVFTGKNLYTLIDNNPDKIPFGKDVIYRFLRKACVNWVMFLFRLSCRVIKEVDKLTSEGRKSVLIIDDSSYVRNRSKKVELLSRCRDHATGKYYKGLTLITIGWSDGQTFIPVSFRLLGSGNDANLLEGAQANEDNRTLATKRRVDARTDKPAMALSMLEAIKGSEAQAKHVVFDSWYASPSFILSVKQKGYDVVARLKNHKNHQYIYNGETLPVSAIHDMNKKRRGKSKYLLSVTVEVRHNGFPGTVPAKIVFVRDRSNIKNWIALLSTDTALTEEEIICLYGKRWDIEPFHKIIKSCLRLEKEFQLRSYEAMTAHATIVMTRYVLLSLENRENKDFRSINDGFHALCQELDDISFSFAFDLIISVFIQCLNDYFHLAKHQISEFVDRFITCLPSNIKDKLIISLCES